MSAQQPPKEKLDFLSEKSLLQLIEDKNQPREEICLKDICDTRKDIFGEPGTNKRRDIQYHWKNLKNRSIRSWKDHIEQKAQCDESNIVAKIGCRFYNTINILHCLHQKQNCLFS